MFFLMRFPEKLITETHGFFLTHNYKKTMFYEVKFITDPTESLSVNLPDEFLKTLLSRNYDFTNASACVKVSISNKNYIFAIKQFSAPLGIIEIPDSFKSTLNILKGTLVQVALHVMEKANYILLQGVKKSFGENLKIPIKVELEMMFDKMKIIKTGQKLQLSNGDFFIVKMLKSDHIELEQALFNIDVKVDFMKTVEEESEKIQQETERVQQDTKKTGHTAGGLNINRSAWLDKITNQNIKK